MASRPSVQSVLTWVARRWLVLLTALGALLLLVAELLTLYEVVAITARIPGSDVSAGSHHGYALALIALASVPFAVGAVVGGSRPAAIAVLGLGIAALFVTLAIDLPDVGDEGLLAESYENAEAQPRAGLWVELVGSLVVLTAGALMFARTKGAERTSRPRRAARRSGGDAGEADGATAR